MLHISGDSQNTIDSIPGQQIYFCYSVCPVNADIAQMFYKCFVLAGLLLFTCVDSMGMYIPTVLALTRSNSFPKSIMF